MQEIPLSDGDPRVHTMANNGRLRTIPHGESAQFNVYTRDNPVPYRPMKDKLIEECSLMA